jgi:hypothetical protein
MPARIDKHVMPTFSGANQAQVLHALKYLGLTDELGVPTDKLYKLVKVLDDKDAYSETMLALLDDAYPFLNGIDHTTGTDGQINEGFSKVASGDTVRKAKSFWLAAMKDAGATFSPYIKEPGKRGPTPGGKRVRGAKPSGTAAKTQVDQTPPPPAATSKSWQEMLLAKFPNFDPQWPDEVKAKWFAGFNDLMKKGEES